MTWLCTPAAKNVNGRDFYIGGDEVAMLSPPEFVSTLFHEGGWTVDALDRFAPAMTGGLTDPSSSESLHQRRLTERLLREPSWVLNIVLEAVMQTVVAGLMAGIIYGLMASGVGLIFGVMRVVNFAQGEFLMLGMYGAVFAAALIAPLGLFGVTLGAYIGVLLTGPVIFILGAIIHRVVLRAPPASRAAGTRSEGHYTQMILTLGVSLIFQSVALAWFGAVPRQNQTPISDQAWTMRPFPGVDAEVFVNQGHAVSCLVALALGRRDLPGVFADVASASRCGQRPTIRSPRPTSGSGSTARTASLSPSAWRSPPSPADWSRSTTRSSRTWASSSSSSCTRPSCWADWGRSSAHSGAASSSASCSRFRRALPAARAAERRHLHRPRGDAVLQAGRHFRQERGPGVGVKRIDLSTLGIIAAVCVVVCRAGERHRQHVLPARADDHRHLRGARSVVEPPWGLCRRGLVRTCGVLRDRRLHRHAAPFQPGTSRPGSAFPRESLLAALAAVLIGLPTLRLRGIHFALAMLAYPIVLRYVLDWLRYQEVMLPRKAQDAAWFMQYDDVRVYALFAIALLFASLCICHVIENSRFGLALRAIKENEQAAAAARHQHLEPQDGRHRDQRRNGGSGRRPLRAWSSASRSPPTCSACTSRHRRWSSRCSAASARFGDR